LPCLLTALACAAAAGAAGVGWLTRRSDVGSSSAPAERGAALGATRAQATSPVIVHTTQTCLIADTE
jgi:hypothetical protein